MNFLNLLANLLAGLLAGYSSWLSIRSSSPWALGDSFQATLLETGVFAAAFLGFSSGLLSLGNEMLYRKALRLFGLSAAIGLAVPMLCVVVFALVFDVLGAGAYFPSLVIRGFWWISLAMSMSLARGINLGSTRAGGVAFVGLAPGLLVAGLAMDSFFLPHGLWLPGALVLGISAGGGLALSQELLKDSWLEGTSSRTLAPQFILETEEFAAGSGPDCDLTIEDGSFTRFVISEKDGIHFLEVLDDDPIHLVGRGRFRYRALVDGDAIEVGDQTWVYHTRVSRTRYGIPEEAAT